MAITVKFFASLRERVGRDEMQLEAEGLDDVAAVWQRAGADIDLPDTTLAAVNLEYVGMEHAVSDGDEVAFFPPVTGG